MLEIKKDEEKITSFPSIKKNKKNEIVVTTNNELILPLAILDALFIGILMALNFIFRYDSNTRYQSDMVNFSKVLLSCDLEKLQYELSRPYFDYGLYSSKSLEGLELNYDMPDWVFFLTILLTPIGIFCFIETMRALFPAKYKKEIQTFNYIIPQPFRRVIRIIGGYLLGGSLAGLLTSLMKLNITSPRPHFMSVCFNTNQNTDFTFCDGLNLWKPSEVCVEGREEKTVEALKSFPSYHATLAVYSAVFTTAYLILTAKIRRIYNTPAIFILCIILMGFIGAFHRLGSGHSFPRDILGGAFIGFVAAYYTIAYILNNFQERKRRIKKILRRALSSSSRGKKATSKLESKDSDTDFDSDDSSDYDNIVSKINGSYPMIPRVPDESPMQAVNPTMQVDDRLRAPRNPPVPLPKRGGYSSRSNSSVGQTWNTRNANQPYEVPRQRFSAPSSKVGSVHGLTNYGYTSSTKQESRGILTAYEPSRNDSSSYF